MTNTITLKPIDLLQEGTAYSLVSWQYPTNLIPEENISKLESILRHGILGSSRAQEDSGGFGCRIISKERYQQESKEGHKKYVYFNILGRRRIDGERNDEPIVEGNEIGILFDISSFKEGEPYFYNEPLMNDGEYGVYRGRPENNPKSYPGWTIGKSRVESDWGFVISPMIEPKYFQGVIFGMQRKINLEETTTQRNKMVEKIRKRIKEIKIKYSENKKNIEYWTKSAIEYFNEWNNNLENTFVQETDHTKLEKRAQQIGNEISNSGLIIPVYDSKGNIWWPDNIPYEKLRAGAEI